MRKILAALSGATVLMVYSAVLAVADDVDGARFVATTTESAADPSPAPNLECSFAECVDRWTATAGGIVLHRSTARSALLVEHRTSLAELSNVSDFDLGFAAGPQFELTRHFDSDWELGVRHFNVDGWSTSRQVADAGNLRVPLVSSSDYFDTASATYQSRLYSTEIDLKRKWTEWLRTLVGFRWVELHEHVQGEALSTALEGTFDIRSHNCLYGIQLGSEVTFWNHGGPMRVDGFLKAGMYDNEMMLAARGQGTNFNMDGSIPDQRTAFLGELGVTATYRLSRNWSLYAGYEAMWLSRISLAADTIAAMNQEDTTILFNGDAFYHGATAGISLVW